VSTTDPVIEERPLETPSLAIEEHDGVTIIRLFGEHDVETAAGITTEITRAAIGGAGVVLSLAGITFMDSSVIHALVVGDKRLIQDGRRLLLHVEPGSPADRVLELCRLNEMLCFGDTLHDAIAFAKQTADEPPAA
jgi:anti-anti-sigma factor